MILDETEHELIQQRLIVDALREVVPARQLGMKAILVRTGLHRSQRPRLSEEVPDIELPDETGLPAAVRERTERAS